MSYVKVVTRPGISLSLGERAPSRIVSVGRDASVWVCRRSARRKCWTSRCPWRRDREWFAERVVREGHGVAVWIRLCEDISSCVIGPAGRVAERVGPGELMAEGVNGRYPIIGTWA